MQHILHYRNISTTTYNMGHVFVFSHLEYNSQNVTMLQKL